MNEYRIVNKAYYVWDSDKEKLVYPKIYSYVWDSETFYTKRAFKSYLYYYLMRCGRIDYPYCWIRTDNKWMSKMKKISLNEIFEFYN